MRINRKELTRILRTSPLRNSSVYHLVRYRQKKHKCDKVIKRFVKEDISASRRAEIKRGMRQAMVRYHWDFDEYFMYNYEALTPAERHSFVPEYEKNIFCARVNDPEKSLIFDQKWATYETFAPFFGRDVIFLRSAIDLSAEAFASFFCRHDGCIVKPNSEASGRGIRVMSCKDAEDARKQILEAYGETFRNLVVEELIRQDDRMGCFHPQSVNTLRMRTFRFDDRVELLPCNMRIGQGDAVVDNTGKGGISVALDMDGRVVTAADEAGNRYEVHPDTKLQIVGFQVPMWDEAVELVKQLALVVPEVRYVGWDIALSDKGWVLIEGNDKSMFVGIQKATQKGFRPTVDRILEEMHTRL